MPRDAHHAHSVYRRGGANRPGRASLDGISLAVDGERCCARWKLYQHTRIQLRKNALLARRRPGQVPRGARRLRRVCHSGGVSRVPVRCLSAAVWRCVRAARSRVTVCPAVCCAGHTLCSCNYVPPRAATVWMLSARPGQTCMQLYVHALIVFILWWLQVPPPPRPAQAALAPNRLCELY